MTCILLNRVLLYPKLLKRTKMSRQICNKKRKMLLTNVQKFVNIQKVVLKQQNIMKK